MAHCSISLLRFGEDSRSRTVMVDRSVALGDLAVEVLDIRSSS